MSNILVRRHLPSSILINFTVPEASAVGRKNWIRKHEVTSVLDAAQGILAAAERYDGGEPVNLGSGEELAIRELAAIVAEETGFAGTVRWDASKPNGQPRRKLDVSRAERLFGWKSRTRLAEGLRKTIDWYAPKRGG